MLYTVVVGCRRSCPCGVQFSGEAKGKKINPYPDTEMIAQYMKQDDWEKLDVQGRKRLLCTGRSEAAPQGSSFRRELSSDGEPVTGRPRGRDPAGAERVQRHRGGNQPGVLRVQILNHTAELRTPVGARGRVPTEGSERPLLRPPGLRFVFCKVAACGSTFLQHLSFFGGDVPGSLSSAAGDPVVLLP